MKPSNSSLNFFQRRLWAWFRLNKRPMPWRSTRDPYRIWLSEVMLQQTRVTAVLPYYRRFVRRFPTVRRLACARTEEVLRYWAGLGYYSRARNLHRAAKEIVARHGSRFPRDYDAALALPGVGRYTAAAVLSIAYGQPLAVVDGNVARVLARLHAIRGDLRAPKRWKRLEADAQRLLDARAPGDWNQAMMELGATVCTPRAPKCAACPLAKACRAYRLGIAGELPTPRTKRAPVEVEVAAAVLLDGRGRTLLVRQQNGLFSGMWQFPAVEVKGKPEFELTRLVEDLKTKTQEISQRNAEVRRAAEKNWRELPAVQHTVTFRQITLRPFLIRVATLPSGNGSRRIALNDLNSLPVSSATRKVADAAAAAAL